MENEEGDKGVLRNGPDRYESSGLENGKHRLEIWEHFVRGDGQNCDEAFRRASRGDVTLRCWPPTPAPPGVDRRSADC